MALQRSKPRGSSYRQKIDAVTLHVAYEGAEDEKDYFEQVARAIPKQFANLLKLIPVAKSSTASAPCKVYDDLCSHLIKENVKLSSNSDFAFLVIDKDHHFSNSHQRNTREAITSCKQRNIEVLCNSPCFEVWLLCHYLDLDSADQTFKNKALENKSSFLKKQVRAVRQGEATALLIKRTNIALANETKLKGLGTANDIPAAGLQSNVGRIIQVMIEHGIPITQLPSFNT